MLPSVLYYGLKRKFCMTRTQCGINAETRGTYADTTHLPRTLVVLGECCGNEACPTPLLYQSNIIPIILIKKMAPHFVRSRWQNSTYENCGGVEFSPVIAKPFGIPTPLAFAPEEVTDKKTTLLVAIDRPPEEDPSDFPLLGNEMRIGK